MLANVSPELNSRLYFGFFMKEERACFFSPSISACQTSAAEI
jgi:hypothetical protein